MKFSKDFLVTHVKPEFQKSLRACGWWTINRDKLQTSPADFWVFVLLGFDRRSKDYVIIPPKELLRRLESIHGSQKTIQSYLWVTTSENCWETRGLKSGDQLRLGEGRYRNPTRNLTKWLNNWTPVERLNY